MNVPFQHAGASQHLMIVDCDIHPAYRTPADLHPFLPARWREHMTTFGEHLRQGLSGQLAWPRMMAAGMRLDAFPEAGPPGSDLELMRRQHLDANGVEYGMLMQLSRGGMEERNLDFAAALSHAVNDWQLEEWVKPEPRLRAGIVVPQEDAAFAVSEIERRANDPAFVQILISPRASDPLGHRRYWPIYEAAQRCRRPIALHVQGYSGGHASTGSGWPTYYMQEHYATTTGMQNTVTSLVFEGVFERFPEAEGSTDRRRVHLGAVAVLAHGQALATHAQGNCRISSGRRLNTCATISGSPPSRSRSRRFPHISPTSSPGSVGTG